jgi:hypothetical protein
MGNDNYSATLIDGVKALESQHVDLDTVGGYEVPVDPMDLLQCDSCQ